jgi:hypothetical protein
VVLVVQAQAQGAALIVAIQASRNDVIVSTPAAGNAAGQAPSLALDARIVAAVADAAVRALQTASNTDRGATPIAALAEAIAAAHKPLAYGQGGSPVLVTRTGHLESDAVGNAPYTATGAPGPSKTH